MTSTAEDEAIADLKVPLVTIPPMFGCLQLKDPARKEGILSTVAVFVRFVPELFASFSCPVDFYTRRLLKKFVSHSCWQNLESLDALRCSMPFFFSNRLIPRLELRTLCGASHPSASEINYRVHGWRGRMRPPNEYIFATQGGHTQTHRFRKVLAAYSSQASLSGTLASG